MKTSASGGHSAGAMTMPSECVEQFNGDGACISVHLCNLN